MKLLNLLNAITLGTQQYIIIGVAAALLVAIIAVIVSVAIARKRNIDNASAVGKRRSPIKTVKKSVVKEQPKQLEQPEQPVTNAVNQSVADLPTENTVYKEAEFTQVGLDESVVAESEVADEADDDEQLSQDELDELVVAESEAAENAENADGADDVEEEITVQLDDNDEGNIVLRRIIYNRSFLARLTQASDEVKTRYSELKNELLSYAKVKPALSWKRERFSIGRNTFACFVMRGKKLCLRFATDPKRFADTKYKVVDMSIRSPKSKQPCMYRITSERRVKYAKEIIAMLLAEQSVEKLADPAEQNYTMPYRETDALIDDGLIKVKVIEGADNTVTTLNDAQQVKSIVKQTEQLPKRDFKILPKIEATEVDVMSDVQAAKIIEYKVVRRKKTKGVKGIINIDVLSRKFPAGALITIDVLREQHIIPSNVNSIKVLAKGILDKPLIIEADDFSLQAVKMIALTGGRVIRTSDK